MAAKRVRLIVVRSGFQPLDFFHASGLAICIAELTGKPVALEDKGFFYTLTPQVKVLPVMTPADLLKRLSLPTKKSLLNIELAQLQKPDVRLATLDGLLAVLFTARGIRVVSVDNMLDLSRVRGGVVDEVLRKVFTLIKRLAEFLSRSSMRHSLQCLAVSYNSTSPVSPAWDIARGSTLSVPMPVTPALSYSIRQASSQSNSLAPTGVTLTQPALAPVFVLIGAARFLRAQRVAGKLVNFYVHLPYQLEIQPNVTMPLLSSTDVVSHQAVLALALQVCSDTRGEQYVCLHWHTLQTQGLLQSFCIDQGSIATSRLRQLVTELNEHTTEYWRRLLCGGASESRVQVEHLVDSLLHRRLLSWLQHCIEVALLEQWPIYTLADHKEIANYMSDSHLPVLRHILAREQGTLRFGKTLWLLRRFNASLGKDLIAKLSVIRNKPQLFLTLADVAIQAEIAMAKTKYMLVPDRDDAAYLADDVEQWGIELVVSILILLSAVRYPKIEPG